MVGNIRTDLLGRFATRCIPIGSCPPATGMKCIPRGASVRSRRGAISVFAKPLADLHFFVPDGPEPVDQQIFGSFHPGASDNEKSALKILQIKILGAFDGFLMVLQSSEERCALRLGRAGMELRGIGLSDVDWILSAGYRRVCIERSAIIDRVNSRAVKGIPSDAFQFLPILEQQRLGNQPADYLWVGGIEDVLGLTDEIDCLGDFGQAENSRFQFFAEDCTLMTGEFEILIRLQRKLVR